jgi:hypothetical protein
MALSGEVVSLSEIESFEAAFALQILQMTHDRPSPQNAL